MTQSDLQDEQDEFWKDNKYFKKEDLENENEPDEDYQKETSVEDSFDSDFFKSASSSSSSDEKKSEQ